MINTITGSWLESSELLQKNILLQGCYLYLPSFRLNSQVPHLSAEHIGLFFFLPDFYNLIHPPL